MIELNPATISAIAAEVIRQMRFAESTSMDALFLVSLPPGEMKRRLKAEFDLKTRKRPQEVSA